jgi:hypothetical protein
VLEDVILVTDPAAKILGMMGGEMKRVPVQRTKRGLGQSLAVGGERKDEHE